MIEDGVTGFVVDADDESTLIERTERLVLDPVLRGAMGARARARCLAYLSMEATAEKWQRLIEELLSVSRSRTV